MSEEEVQCMECSKNIKTQKNSDILLYKTPLKREEKISEIKNKIETQNLEDIKTGVCISCLHESLSLIKTNLNEEEQKHDDCLKALKDLLLDISNQKDINKIIDNLLNEKEIKELKEKHEQLYKKRRELENKIKENKDELNMLKDEEGKIIIKINENERKKEDLLKYKEKLNMKKEYLQKIYEQIIQEE